MSTDSATEASSISFPYTIRMGCQVPRGDDSRLPYCVWVPGLAVLLTSIINISKPKVVPAGPPPGINLGLLVPPSTDIFIVRFLRKPLTILINQPGTPIENRIVKKVLWFCRLKALA